MKQQLKKEIISLDGINNDMIRRTLMINKRLEQEGGIPLW